MCNMSYVMHLLAVMIETMWLWRWFSFKLFLVPSMQPELELCHALISFDCSGAGGQLDRQMLQQFLQQQALETLPGPELWGSPVTQNHGVNCVNTFFFVSWCLNCSSALASCLLLWLVTLCVWGFLLEGSGSWMAVGVVLFNVPVSCRDTHRDMWVAYAPIHICVITWELTHADLQYKTESWKEVWEGEPVDKSPPKWIRHLYEQSVRRRRGYPTGELHP